MREVDSQLNRLSASASPLDQVQAAKMALGIGDLWRAEAFARGALKTAPNDRQARMILANAVSQQERFETARQLYIQLNSEDPRELEPYLQLQSIAVRQRKATEGWQWLSRAQVRAAQTSANMIALAHRYYYLNDVPSAQKTLDRAARIAPDDVNVQLQRAILLYQRVQLDEARAILDTVLRTHPDNEPAIRLLAGVYVHPAYHEQDNTRANDLLERAVALDRKDAEVYRLAAIVYRRLRLLRMAAEAYNAFLILEPRNADERYGLGQTYTLLGLPDLAKSQFELSRKLREAEQRISALSSAVSQSPLSAETHTALAQGLEDNGDDAGALRELQVAAGLAPTDRSITTKLDYFYRRLGWSKPSRSDH